MSRNYIILNDTQSFKWYYHKGELIIELKACQIFLSFDFPININTR